METTFRVGLGYDAHAFEEGRALVLGGVKIPFPKGLSGHSDADVVCHAIADALLGAISAGDIGQLFPDTDPQYEGISSLTLLTQVRDLVLQKGGRIVNVDAMLILEEPRVSDCFGEMKKRVAEALEIDTSIVSIKATRNEAMGFIGRKEGAAALSVALVTLPEVPA
jgi:2-C-methyl-D-erythritol 2,4-cyclodiphosphate synthase